VGAIGRITTRVFAVPLPRFLSLVVLMYVGAWLLSFAAGGASAVPPHAFYVPIAVVGIKFGIRGAVVGGVVAALVAGPALPADVSTGIAQTMSEWVSRGGFFVAVGATVTHLTNAAVGTVLAAAERESELLHAIEADQLVVQYQPVVRIDTGVVVGAEALVRWAHPTRGLVGPCDFVPFAEERGIIGAIGHWVLQRSVSDMHEWKDTPGIENIPIRELAINVSRRQFCEGAQLLDQLDDLIRDRPLPIQLVVEVTETALAEDPALLTDRLNDLKRRGVQVAIDDFGTGQSSVAAVRDLPIDIIKIDKTFVDQISGAVEDVALIKAIIQLSKSFGLSTVAEGIEEAGQAERLATLGCLLGQGFLWSRPVPPGEISDVLGRQLTAPVRESA
jgi:EAL domain-containing protein (putative c-di-GMP-specific phosphodiesterase class I)